MKALVLTALAALAIASCDDGTDAPKPRQMPTGVWEIGPIIDGKSLSPGMPPFAVAGADGYSFEIPFPDKAAGHVHYVTKATGSLYGKARLVLRYRIDAAPDTVIEPQAAPGAPSMLSLYFQRRGDDWSGRGIYEAFRWYSPVIDMPVTPGEHEITAPLDGEWTAVMTSSASSNPDGFRAALINAERVGFVLGGGDGRGHGVYATAPARFVILDYRVEG